MKFNKIIFVFLALLLVGSVYAKERSQVNINFKNLEIEDFIKLTSKVLNKNILTTAGVKGAVDFISAKPVYEDELLDLLQSVLAAKGFTIVENDAYMEVVRLSEASTYNLPVDQNKQNAQQMVTQVIKIKNEDVNAVASKIRHLISKSAKLVTIQENNSMLLTDFPPNIATIMEVVKVMEENKAKKVVFIEIENVKVQQVFAQVTQILKDLFNPKIVQQRVNIIPSIDSNTLVIVGYEQQVNMLKTIVKKFDVQDEKTKQHVEIITLKNSTAENTFKAVQFVVKSKKYPTPDATPVVSVDADTNSIIVLGPKEAIDDIQKIIQELDREKPQVYVKAQIIEVNEGLVDKIGAKYGLLAGMSNSGGLFGFAANLVGESSFNILNTLQNFNTTTGGSDLSGNVKNALVLSATIDLLKQNSAVNIVSEPSILCVNNKESSIYVGETKSIQTGTETTSGGNTINKYSREDIGLTLKIKPLISNDKKVTLEITAILEDVAEASTNSQPDTTKKEIKTVALVRDGENVIIGGLIKNKVDSVKSKVPILGDIPILGIPFRHTSETNNKINLVVILTPYIVEASSDLTSLRTKLQSLDNIKAQVSLNLSKYLESKENNASD